MRRFATLTWLLAMGDAQAQERALYARQAVVVDIATPGPSVEPLTQASPHAAELAETLQRDSGFERVNTLSGDSATAEAVEGLLHESMASTAADGLLLVVVVGHGVGGDIGEPALLTPGTSMADPVGTGLSVARLSAALRPQTTSQNVVVVMDVAHDKAVDGVALIGPSASDWPSLPEWGVAVTSKASGVGGEEGKILPAMSVAMQGAADFDADGVVNISELYGYLESTLGPGFVFERAGAVAANLVMSTAGRTAEVTREPPRHVPGRPTDKAPMKLSPVAVGVASAGVVSALISAGMYAAKRGECEQQGDQLVCGDDAAYRRYRNMQVALGWTGVGLVAAGIGLQFVPLQDGAMVGVIGSF